MKWSLSLGRDFAIHHPDQHHDPDIVVEPGIDDQGLQRRAGISRGGGTWR